jgi:dimethylargininase
MIIAITRGISPAMQNCELTNLARQPIDLELAGQQHAYYVRALEAAGCRVVELPAHPDLPDSVFVEDIAVVLDEIAIITRPGALSRRAETPAVVQALEPYRRRAYILEPGTIDGGDVLLVGRTLYIGVTLRTNAAAVQQMSELVAPLGYEVRHVPVTGCLHLKSAVTQVGEDTLLINRAWVDASNFVGMRLIDVHPSEPHAANGLLVGSRLIYPAEYPLTLARLEQAGINVLPVPASEVAKAEGAVTCCSLIFNA